MNIIDKLDREIAEINRRLIRLKILAGLTLILQGLLICWGISWLNDGDQFGWILIITTGMFVPLNLYTILRPL